MITNDHRREAARLIRRMKPRWDGWSWSARLDLILLSSVKLTSLYPSPCSEKDVSRALQRLAEMIDRKPASPCWNVAREPEKRFTCSRCGISMDKESIIHFSRVHFGELACLVEPSFCPSCGGEIMSKPNERSERLERDSNEDENRRRSRGALREDCI